MPSTSTPSLAINRSTSLSSIRSTNAPSQISATSIDKDIDFEQLITSGETVKVTLTPNRLRTIEVNNRNGSNAKLVFQAAYGKNAHTVGELAASNALENGISNSPVYDNNNFTAESRSSKVSILKSKDTEIPMKFRPAGKNAQPIQSIMKKPRHVSDEDSQQGISTYNSNLAISTPHLTSTNNPSINRSASHMTLSFNRTDHQDISSDSLPSFPVPPSRIDSTTGGSPASTSSSITTQSIQQPFQSRTGHFGDNQGLTSMRSIEVTVDDNNGNDINVEAEEYDPEFEQFLLPEGQINKRRGPTGLSRPGGGTVVGTRMESMGGVRSQTRNLVPDSAGSVPVKLPKTKPIQSTRQHTNQDLLDFLNSEPPAAVAKSPSIPFQLSGSTSTTSRTNGLDSPSPIKNSTTGIRKLFRRGRDNSGSQDLVEDTTSEQSIRNRQISGSGSPKSNRHVAMISGGNKSPKSTPLIKQESTGTGKYMSPKITTTILAGSETPSSIRNGVSKQISGISPVSGGTPPRNGSPGTTSMNGSPGITSMNGSPGITSMNADATGTSSAYGTSISSTTIDVIEGLAGPGVGLAISTSHSSTSIDVFPHTEKTTITRFSGNSSDSLSANYTWRNSESNLSSTKRSPLIPPTAPITGVVNSGTVTYSPGIDSVSSVKAIPSVTTPLDSKDIVPDILSGPEIHVMGLGTAVVAATDYSAQRSAIESLGAPVTYRKSSISNITSRSSSPIPRQQKFMFNPMVVGPTSKEGGGRETLLAASKIKYVFDETWVAELVNAIETAKNVEDCRALISQFVSFGELEDRSTNLKPKENKNEEEEEEIEEMNMEIENEKEKVEEKENSSRGNNQTERQAFEQSKIAEWLLGSYEINGSNEDNNDLETGEIADDRLTVSSRDEFEEARTIGDPMEIEHENERDQDSIIEKSQIDIKVNDLSIS